MLVERAVGPERLVRGSLDLPDRHLERLDPFLDGLELFCAFVQRGQSLRDLVEPRRDAVRLLRHLFERFADRHQLHAARCQVGQHGAQRASLFTRVRDEGLQIGLLLSELFLTVGPGPEGIQHEENLRVQIGYGIADDACKT